VTQPVVRTESLGGSPLSQAARAGRLPDWYPSVPRGADDWRTHADRVTSSVDNRWLDALAPAIAASGSAGERLARSAGGKGAVVTTGQQPGLFGGPLMTLAKAITARALADTLEEMTGMPVAPVFWAATDDADFDEAAVVSISLDDGAHELRLESRAPAGTPMSRVPMDDEITALLPSLRGAAASTAHASFVAAVEQAYRPGATIGDAYVAVLRDVLQPIGIAVLDASHPCVTQAGARLLRAAAAQAEQVSAALHMRTEAIRAAGYAPQVEEVPGLSLVFTNEQGIKRRLPIAEALKLAGDRQLSATVLLRPVLERAILPTLAYVAGPGEIAYFAQVSAVADALGAERQLVVPRWSTTIVDARTQRTLDDFHANVEELADPHAVFTRAARERLPEGAGQALNTLRADTLAGVDRLRGATNGLLSDPVVDGLRRSLEHRLARTERRLVAAVKAKEVEVMRRLSAARGSLFPHGVRQERKLAYIPFLARYGPALVEQLLDAARAHARAVVAGSPAIPVSATQSPQTARR
jgi:uncharacterized protein YllA (UPF0747 family)